MPSRIFVCALLAVAVALPARLRAQAWTLDPALAPTLVNDTSVLQGTSFVPFAGGDWLAYGYFTHANGVAASRIARFKSTGALDSSFTFTPAEGENVLSVAPLPDGRVMAVTIVYSSVIRTATDSVNVSSAAPVGGTIVVAAPTA